MRSLAHLWNRCRWPHRQGTEHGGSTAHCSPDRAFAGEGLSPEILPVRVCRNAGSSVMSHARSKIGAWTGHFAGKKRAGRRSRVDGHERLRARARQLSLRRRPGMWFRSRQRLPRPSVQMVGVCSTTAGSSMPEMLHTLPHHSAGGSRSRASIGAFSAAPRRSPFAKRLLKHESRETGVRVAFIYEPGPGVASGPARAGSR